MNYSLILIIAFILLLVLFILNMLSTLRIKKLENKLMNVSYQDIQVLTNELKELIIESERVSENISAHIEVKENILEDLSDLTDLKLDRFENIISNSKKERSIKESILMLSKQELTHADIAKKLNLSVAEVSLFLRLHN